MVRKISTKILDYEENVRKGNLLILDLEPYYGLALKNDFKPFEDLKKSIIEKVKERSDKHVRFYGDLGSFLFKNKHFEQCLLLEEWWQNNPFVGTKICPYQNSMFNEYPYGEQKEQVIHAHDCIIPC